MSNLNFLHSGGNKVTISAPASNPSSDITFKLPQADGSSGQAMVTNGSGALAFASQGITMLDQYYLASTKTGTAGQEITLDADFNRVSGNVTGAGHIGTGMSKASGGIFSFPSTGIYLINFRTNVMLDSGTSSNRYAENKIYITTNNSSYSYPSMGLDGIVSGSGERFGHPTAEFVFDVTNTSTHKCKFSVQSGNDAYKIYCPSSGRMDTVVTFMRIGDT